MRPFLITGCGRSGTGWAARLFTELGYQCGHELEHSPWKAGPLEHPDSSWLAIPHLPKLPAGTPVIRVMRDPYRVVQSVMARGFLAGLDSPYEAFVAWHRPSITEPPDHLGRAIRWAAWWDGPVTDHPHRLLRVDGGGPDLAEHAGALLYATGTRPHPDVLRAALERVGTRVNAQEGERLPRGEIEAHPEGWRIARRAALHGYDD